MTNHPTTGSCSLRQASPKRRPMTEGTKEPPPLTRREFLHLCALTPSLGTLHSLDQVVGTPPAYVAKANMEPTFMGQSLAQWVCRAMLDDASEQAPYMDLNHFGEAAIPQALRMLRDVKAGLSCEDYQSWWVGSYTLTNVGPASVPGLLELLGHGPAGLRRAAVWQLNQLVLCSSWPTQLLLPIVPALFDALTDSAVCETALHALKQIARSCPDLITQQQREPDWGRLGHLLSDPDPDRRLVAADVLLTAGHATLSAQRAVHAVLESADLDRRLEAANILIQHRLFHPHLAATLVEAMLAGQHTSVPDRAELKEIKAEVMRLLSVHLSEATPSIHQTVLWSIHWTGDDRDRALLAGELRHFDANVRATTISVLSWMHVDVHCQWRVSQLLGALSDKAACVRLAANDALGRLKLPAELVADALNELLNDSHPEIRQATVKALADDRRSPVDAQRLRRMMNDADANVRWAVATVLREPPRIADVNARLDALLAALMAGDAKSCTEARNLYWLEHNTAGVVERLRDPLRRWRELPPKAIDALLGMIERLSPASRGLLPELLPLLHGGHPRLQRQVLLAIASFGESALPTLRAIARDGSSSLQELARLKLDELEAGQPIPANQLLAVAAHGSVLRRVAALKALATADTLATATRRVLRQALGDQDIAVRLEAVSTLAERFGSDTDGPPEELMAVLQHDPCSTVRRRAASELGRLGRSADGVIAALLRRVDPLLQSWLLQSLTADGTGRTEILAAVQLFLNSPDSHLRDKAVGAIKKLAAWDPRS